MLASHDQNQVVIIRADDQLSGGKFWTLPLIACLSGKQDGRALKQLPSSCMAGPKICKMRGSATRTST